MKTAIVGIGRMENHYIREWVQHYEMLGIDKIFLYDNNMEDEEHFEDVISDYISSGYVKLIDVRGRRRFQNTAYFECYHTMCSEYDWLGMFDIDEFVDLGHYGNIQEFLSDNKFKDFQCIRIAWKIFDDNDLIKVEDGNYNLKDRFKRCTKERNCKTFVRTGIPDITFTPHGPLGLRTCDPNGNVCNNGKNGYNIDAQFISYDVIETDVWINHYFLKTLEEYITNKMVRLYPDKTDDVSKSQLNIERFWAYNKKTPQKMEFYQNHLKNRQ